MKLSYLARAKIFMINIELKAANSSTSLVDSIAQNYLVTEKSILMRFWENEQPAEPKLEAPREYEAVGYVIEGKAELHLEGKVIQLESGDSWVVPKDTSYSYKITEVFTAVEAANPSAG